MASYARSALKTSVLSETGLVGTDVIDDTELNAQVERATAELYDLLVAANGERYFVTTSGNLTITNVATNTLTPPTFYRIHKLQKLDGGEWRSVPEVEFGDMDRATRRSWVLIGSTVHVVPASESLGTYRVWYTPRFAGYANDAATFDGINGFERYVIAKCCVWVAGYTEADASLWLAELGALTKRIEEMRTNRAAAGPRRWRQTRVNRWKHMDRGLPGDDEHLP